MYILRNPQYLPLNLIDLSQTSVGAEYAVSATNLDAVAVCAIPSDVSVSTGSIVVSYYSRPVIHSASGQVLLGTITIPAGSVAGSVFKNYFRNVECKIGGSIFCVASVAATTSGHAQLFPLSTDDPESDKDSANVVIVSA